MKRSLLLTLAIAHTSAAFGGGMSMHMFQSERAAEQIEETDLKQLMTTYREAWISGTQYPDAGYVPGNFGKPQHVWGEASHWSPFVEAYLAEVKTRCLGRYTTDETCGKLVAHFLGAAGHGIQDQVFDGLFLEKVRDIDHTDQNDTDIGIDMILLREHDRRAFVPKQWYTPTEVLVEVYRSMGLTEAQANASQIKQTTAISAVANVGERIIAPFLAGKYRTRMPWGSKHYVTFPGGVAFGGKATYQFWRYLWSRLNEAPTPTFRLLTTPAANATQVSVDKPSSDNQITVTFDRAIIPASVTTESFRVLDRDGAPVPGRVRLFADNNSLTAEANMIRFHPSTRLRQAHTYHVQLSDQIRDESGNSVLGDSGYQWAFSTEADIEYFTLSHQGKCLGIVNELADTAGVELRTCHDAREQDWFWDTESRLHNRSYPQLCISAGAGPYFPSHKVLAVHCEDVIEQHWRLDDSHGWLSPLDAPNLGLGTVGAPANGQAPRLWDVHTGIVPPWLRTPR